MDEYENIKDDQILLKEFLIKKLQEQAELMRLNSFLLESIYPERTHCLELSGAALITEQWIESIKAELVLIL